jgi:hypothetical protein
MKPMPGLWSAQVIRNNMLYRERVEHELGVEIRWVFFRPLMHAKRVLPMGDQRKQWQKACKRLAFLASGRNQVE